MIEVTNLVKYYGDRRVLHEISFSVEQNDICGFLGPNGSGKSTTMDILSGILGPSAGVAKICGINVVEQPEEAKKYIGYLPDNPPLYLEMRVKDYVEFVADLRKVPKDQKKKAVEQVLEECDIADNAHRIIAHLSKGYRQRVALCAALVHQPQVLILDEPTEGLDPAQIVHIRKLVKQLAQSRTVLMSSHILSEVQEVCNKVVIIHQGRIAATANLNEIHKNVFEFTILDKHEEAEQWFMCQNSVTSVQRRKNALLVTFRPETTENSPEAFIANITREFVCAGFNLVTLKPQESSLERMFFDAIENRITSADNSEISTEAQEEVQNG